METPKTVVFFGRPGSGKSTQFERLTRSLRDGGTHPVVPFVWSRIRDEFMGEATPIQERIREGHAAGKLQPAFLSVSLWGPAFMRVLSGNEHLIVDGLPRQRLEAELFDSLLAFYEREPVHIIELDVPEAVAESRMIARAEIEGREDDVAVAIRKRLGWYETDTRPLLDYFAGMSRYRVTVIDGTKDTEAIATAIGEAIDA